MNPDAHRVLKVDRADPQRGADVMKLQAAVNRRLAARGLDRYECGEDGVYGAATALACRKATWALGGLLATVRLITQSATGRLTVGAQRMIRFPGRREQAQLDRAKDRQAQIAAAARRRVKGKTASTGGARPAERVVVNVVNQSGRGGAKPRIIVLHSTESPNRPGVADLQALAAWFSNPAAQASSHVATDAEGNCARFVADERKAWAQAAYNPVALSVEQVGRAAQKTWPDRQLEATAAYIAYWSHKYGIPIRESTSSGVCRHSDLGAPGGGHSDPGGGYPLGRVLEMARQMLT